MDTFKSASDKKFSSEFVDSREAYYQRVQELAVDQDGLFYVVGSDEFLVQNIALLKEQGISSNQIVLDKHARFMETFLPAEVAQ